MHINVSFVEDDPVFVDFLRNAIGSADDLQLHHIAQNQASGFAILSQSPSDILLIDIGLPDGSGLEIIRKAKSSWPKCQVMVISVFGDRGNILAAIKAGADGYLLKGMKAQEIAEEIRVVHQGGSAISPSIAKELLGHLRSEPDGQSAGKPTQSEEHALTAREQEVLLLANKGLTYSEVATTLNLSVHTVRTFVRRAYQKLQVTSKTEALYELQRSGKILD